MLTFRDLRTQTDVAEWTAGLQARNPERMEVMQYLVGQLKALPFPALVCWPSCCSASCCRCSELLRAHGFEWVACTLELGQFGCVVGFAPFSLSAP